MYTVIQPDLLIGFSDVVRRFYTYYEKEIDALKIKETHAKIIHLIADHEGITQQEIANVSMMKRSSTSEIITEMVKAGLVERRGDASDKRVARIYLSAKGSETAAAIKTYFNEYCARCYKNFSEEEIEVFQMLITKFNYRN